MQLTGAQIIIECLKEQGADTVFSQMVAETLHTDMEHVHIKTVQDTDVSPFDTGAYASRQSFVTGTAVRHCAEILRDKILAYAKTLLPEIEIVQMLYHTVSEYNTVLNVQKEYRPKLFKRVRTFQWMDPIHPASYYY